MIKKLFILMFVVGLFLAKETYSQDAANYNNEVISLRLKVGMITEAEFPEAIANVTKAMPAASLQIETLGNRMFLLPLEDIDTNIYVVTRDNESFCLHLIMDGFEAPTRIKIKKRAEAANGEQSKKALNTIELMKSLLSGKVPQGSASSNLEPQEIFNNGKFRITIDQIYELPGNVKALCLTFENLSSKPVVVPVEHIEIPGLLAISIDSQLLEARPRNTGNKDSRGYTSKAYMIIQG
jgi:hypothetical protein